MIRDDRAALRLLAVWPTVSRELDGDEVVVNYSEWCSLAMLPPLQINIVKCEMLLRLSLALPDGRIHYWVNDFMVKSVELG